MSQLYTEILEKYFEFEEGELVYHQTRKLSGIVVSARLVDILVKNYPYRRIKLHNGETVEWYEHLIIPGEGPEHP